MKGSSGLGLNWESMADPETTLVIYMGLGNVSEISARLINAGLSPHTPAAVINHGTRENQKVITTNLADLPAKVASENLTGPTLMIIGRVVKLNRHLEWFSKVPKNEYPFVID